MRISDDIDESCPLKIITRTHNHHNSNGSETETEHSVNIYTIIHWNDAEPELDNDHIATRNIHHVIHFMNVGTGDFNDLSEGDNYIVSFIS